jgi:hypothetical protein
MHIEYIAQPDRRAGDLILEGFAQQESPREFVLVSAFASLTTVFRLKEFVAHIVQAGGSARLVLGVDLGGTSKEVLREVANWGIPVTIMKNRISGVVFHPKIYVLGWPDRVEIILGSNNLTEGGFYKNYEAAARVIYSIPADLELLKQARRELSRFLDPQPPVGRILTQEYLEGLLSLPGIPSEAETRRSRGETRVIQLVETKGTSLFGVEAVPAPPKLPADLQKLILSARSSQLVEYRRAVAKARRRAKQLPAGSPVKPLPKRPELLAQLDPYAFYMTLTASRGASNPTIPGEQRIPLEAIEMAGDFWGWPANYDRQVSPRLGSAAKEERVYRNWHCSWRTWATDNPSAVSMKTVRMYFYENSSDFRFYSGDLVRLKARAGDIIRLQRIDEPDAVFECVLARQGSPDYSTWLPLLVNQVKAGASNRRFGFA